ncbi:MAG: two-component sensor histidine kinase [Planctomycetes bacterium]|nr:two-component sensor histidine kinase [Planctomycetota bacterium]
MKRTHKERQDEAERLAFLGILAAGLAHEIRNPLSTLEVNLQLLKEDWQDPSTPREARSLRKVETILRETRRLEQILSEFLRFAGRHELSLADLDVHEVLDEILDFVAPEHERASIKIVRAYNRKVPLVSLDRNLFKQAVLNILINARQAMPRGGTLTIRTRAEGDHVRIELADTGTGIGEEDLPHIFKIFFSTKKGGTGLGLPTARRIIEEHEGTLDVETEPGKGACFILRLPPAGSDDGAEPDRA